MGIRNYLVGGGSGTGKTAVASELDRRGHHAVHGDRVLAYQGDPDTGERLEPGLAARHDDDPAFIHRHHIWDVGQVRVLLADRTHAATFLCGGSRNVGQVIDLFDRVFVLEVDVGTLERRLRGRTDEWGSRPAERALILHQHLAREGLPPNAVRIDATRPLARVVDEILARCA